MGGANNYVYLEYFVKINLFLDLFTKEHLIYYVYYY